MKKKVFNFIAIFSVLLPSVSLAQKAVNTGYIDSLFGAGKGLLGDLIGLLIAASVVWFIWNVIKYAMSDEPADKDKAKDQMIRGVIAITVSVSIWGIVAIVQRIFALDGGNAPSDLENMIPGVNGSNNSSGSTANGGDKSSGQIKIFSDDFYKTDTQLELENEGIWK